MNHALLAEHLGYVSDAPRIDAYRRALAKVVRDGASVLDLGAGSGVLGLLACEAGASRVYSVDESRMIEIAREAARANGQQARITFFRTRSTEVVLPEKVDVVVADQMAPFAVGAGLLESFADARARLLRPGGTLVPASIDLWLAPVAAPNIRKAVDAWGERPAGFEFSHVRALALDTAYWSRLEASQVLGPAVRLTTIDLATATGATFTASATLTIERAGRLDGIGGFFSALLAPDVTITSSPLAEDRIHRENMIFPLAAAEVTAGDTVDVHLRINPVEPAYTWTVTLRGTRSVHSTVRGMILSREDLQRSSPTYVPELSSLGEAYRTVLRLADGTHSLEQIEREVASAHSERFPTRDAVAGFVARVLSIVAR